MSEYTTTPNLGLFKPEYNADAEQWGFHLNANSDVLDAVAGSVVNALGLGAVGDGVTDDTAAIQAALDTYAGKAAVLIPKTDQSYLVGPLLVPSNTDLVINGVLLLKPNSTAAALNINSVINVAIRGYGVIDGNAPAQTGSGAPGGVACASSANVSIRDITLRDAYLFNLNVVASNNVLVENVQMFGGRVANEFASGCDGCWLMNCHIDGPSDDGGFSFYGGVTNSGAIGNNIKNAGIGGGNTTSGIFVFCDTAQPAPCSDIVISNNIISGCSGGAVAVVSTVAAVYHGGVVITGNRTHDNCQTSSVSGGDIAVDWSNNVTISDNQISTMHSTHPQYGIWLGGNANGISITGNEIYNIGAGGVGIYLASTNRVFSSGNFVYDSASTGMVSSMAGSAGLANVHIGNNFELPVPIGLQSDTVMSNVINGRLIMANLKTASTGLPTGAIWRNGTVLNIV